MFAEAIGFYLSTTATGSGAGAGTTVVCTNAQVFNDHIRTGFWVRMGAGTTPAGEVRQISAISGATYTVDAFSAQVDSADAIEFFPIHPAFLLAALDQALRNVYPILHQSLLDETLIVDDLLLNSDFETFSGGSFTSWTLGGASAADDEELTQKKHGARSAKLTSASATAQLYQNLTINAKELVGKTIHFERWVAAIATNVARIGFEFASGVTDFGAYHSGSGAAFNQNPHWEYHRHQATIPSTVEYVRCICEVATGTKIGLFDGPGGAWVGRKNKYTIPTSFVEFPSGITVQADENPEGVFVPVRSRLTSGRLLRLEGRGLLSVPTTDAGTTELDEHQAELVVATAATRLFGRMRRENRTDSWDDDIRYWEGEENRLQQPPPLGVKMREQPVKLAHGWWTEAEDASGRYMLVP